MFFSKLKISTKLVISSAVFLIPIGVMLYFVSSMTLGIVQKSRDAQDGLNRIKPIVQVMQLMPEYLDVKLGLKQGNPRSMDEQITRLISSLSDLDDFVGQSWQELRSLELNDINGNEEFLSYYTNFTSYLRFLMSSIANHSGLNLVSDTQTYYLVESALTMIPTAYSRLIEISNITRKNLYDADAVVNRWNNELADAQSLGRRLAASPFTGNSAEITMGMLPSADLQLVRNSRSLFQSDMDSINENYSSARFFTNYDEFSDFDRTVEQYKNTMDILSDQLSRLTGFNITITVAGIFETFTDLNIHLSQLWDETLTHLELQIQRNAGRAQRQLILYLSMAFVTLALAVSLVIFIVRDINRSVKSLKTLFKGLNENDLTLSLPINSKDEFGELMTAFNSFLNILRSTFGSFKQSAQHVANSVFDISSSSKEITTTANEQSTSVSEIVSTMESSKNLSEQIAFKTTEVANLAQETQELSSKGADLREANQTMMEDIRKQNQKIISEIRNLSDMIIRISEAIRIIDGIADQTKLIAFNASLEASSSGEAGARFSVVAAEIRRFADNVVESTHEIKQRIEEVQEASQTLIAEANSGSRQIEIGYERMSEQKIVFENIVENSQNVATRSQQISNLSKQQELASSQIFTALKEISAGVKQFVVATSSTSRIADSLNGMSEDLKDKVEKYRTEGPAAGGTESPSAGGAVEHGE